MRRVVVHIGAPKCGSTFLQRVLVQNRALLRQHNMAYPHSGVGHPGNGDVIYQITRPWLEAAFEHGDTIILSHELLFAQGARARRLGTLAQRMDLEIDIVVFLRPFDEVILGDYSQHLRQHLEAFIHDGRGYHGRSFRQFAWSRQKDIHPANFIAEWQSVLPNARINIAHHTQIKENIVGILPPLAAANWQLPPWRANPSIPRQCCDDILASALRNGGSAQKYLADIRKPPSTRTDARLRDWIRSIFESQRQALIAAYGFDVNTDPAHTSFSDVA